MPSSVLVLIIIFVVLLLMNVPIVVSISLSSFFTVLYAGGIPAANLIAYRMASGVESFSLLAIPFFILSGLLMGRGGMAKRLINFAAAAVGALPGGLAIVNILTCMMFGSISGSAVAAVSSVGGFMIPEMNNKGYDRDFNVAVTATAATTGLMIPPSNVMIVYCLVSGVSVGAMFLSGIFPGILFGLCLMIPALIIGRAKGYKGGEFPGFKVVFLTFIKALPSLLLLFFILGGIISGIMTATEAAAFSVVYSLVFGCFVYREVKIVELFEIFKEAALTTAIVFMLIGASMSMSWIMAYEYIPQALGEFFAGISDNPYIFLLIINFVLLLIGVFMDMTPAILIFAPIFLPAAKMLGIDPIHFGMIMIANLCIGLCTPPVGSCLFVGCSVGKTSIANLIKPMLPFFLAMLVALLILTFVPGLATLLPSVAGI
ncbi:MAG: TRAP transporter large permease [Spirochaetales bacterium]|nr:TRAP transporter large permease [Spirochaetales bacterium]